MIRFEEVRRFCHGRRVAVVGNSRIVLDRSDGAEIDAHDLVVRLNRGFPEPTLAAHLGRRTDLWCPSGISNHADLVGYAARFRERYKLWLRGVWARIPHELWHNLHVVSPWAAARLSLALGAPPSTGTALVDLLLRRTSCRVTLFGFDFFRSPNTRRARGVLVDRLHDPGREAAYLRTLASAHPTRLELRR